MSEKIEVVYIGPKPTKRLTVFGRKYIFQRLKPVAIETDAAYHLLDIPLVFCTPEEAESRISEHEQAIVDEEKAKKAAEQAKEAEEKDQSYLVVIDGEKKDISKYTIAKLKTVIEAEDLEIPTDRKTAAEIRKEVRAALHQKHGNPEV